MSQRWTALILWGVTLITNMVAMAVQGMSALVITVTGIGIVWLLALVVWRRGRSLAQSMACKEVPEGRDAVDAADKSCLAQPERRLAATNESSAPADTASEAIPPETTKALPPIESPGSHSR